MSESLERDLEVDRLCEKFEAALKAGERPTVADYLAQAPTSVREPLQVELDRILNAFRASDAETTTAGNGTLSSDGMQIGPYALVERIGEGGMGEVWLAQQKEPVRRRVALKFIKAGMDSKAVLGRFEQERQALALLDHPNIARVLDAGLTPERRPYFVMELVKGLPLTKFCDEAKLGIPERLQLFVTICQAVQHAHHKGIVHRDLKPSNILVTSYDAKPVAKIIDLGVAKAMGGKLTDESISTQMGTVVGTLEYMAPEQAGMSAADVDTRADIYSLGVILYELLTGLRPFDAKRMRDAPIDELIRIVRTEDPPRPSTRLSTDKSLPAMAAARQTEPATLSALLRGDLDWIVMKCLEKERARRYETANSLARDIERYFANEPIEARPPSAGYKLRKFVRRNRGAVLAGALVLLVLVGAVVGTTWGLFRAKEAEAKAIAEGIEKERARKEAEAKEAETASVLGFVDRHVFAAGRPKGRPGGLGKDVKLAEAVAAALRFVDTSFPEQPLTEARLRMTLGASFMYLGNAKSAEPQFAAARHLYEAHLGHDHPDTLTSLHELATSYHANGRYEEALTLRETTVAKRQSKLGPNHPDTLKSLNNLANSYSDLNRANDALRLRLEVLAVRQSKLEPDHPDTLSSMHNLANSYHDVGRYAEALKLREEVLSRRQALLGPDHLDTLLSLSQITISYQVLGRYQEALERRQEVAKRQTAQLGLDHPDTLTTLSNLAVSYSSLKRYEEALKLRQQLLAIRLAKFGPDHLDTLVSLSSLANSYADLGRYEEALKGHEETLARRTAQLGPDHPDTLTSMSNLALGYRASGKLDQALPLFEQTLKLRKDKLGPDHPNTLTSMNNLALGYQDSGKLDQALPLFEEMFKLRKSKQGPDHPDTLQSMKNLGKAYADAWWKSGPRW